MSKRIILFSAVVAFMVPTVRGQSIWPSTLNATGGSATLGGNTYEYSVGEMTLVSTFVTSTVVVTQGILQPEGGVTAVTDHTFGEHLQVFPNPSSSYVNVQYVAAASGELTMRLLDITGKLISEDRMTVKQGINTRQIDVSNLAAATYMLQVTTDQPGEQASYKIQKLQ